VESFEAPVELPGEVAPDLFGCSSFCSASLAIGLGVGIGVMRVMTAMCRARLSRWRVVFPDEAVMELLG
jgi:hypothetical protein